IALREDASVDFLESEDAINTSSLFSACDMYLLDGEGKRSGIAQLGFDREPLMQFDLMLGANRPLDVEYVVAVEEFEWMNGCAFIVLDDNPTPQPLEAGELTHISLPTGVNTNHTVATVYLVPFARAEISSPGCEGSGETSIDVLATGDGPWLVTLTDGNGQTVSGSASADGVVTSFGDLTSGVYTYAIDNQGTMGCGAVAGAHTVIRPTSLAIATDVTHDCGDGGTVVANVANEEVTYDWSHGATGAEISGLEGGTYTVVATNDYGCKDTLDVTVLSAPDVLVTSTDGTCDGNEDAEIEVDAMHESARYNVILRDAEGVEIDALLDQETPLFFDNITSGTYTVELQLLGAYGCAPETEEISVVQPVPMTLTSASESQCDSDQLGSASTTLVGGTGEVTYMWSNGTQEANLTDVEAGEYTVTVTDEAGCQKSTSVTVAQSPQLDVTVVAPGCDGTGVSGFNLASASDATWTVDVYNQEGTLVESITASEEFDVNDLPTGTYTLTYSDDVNDGCPAKSTVATVTEASNLEVAVITTPMTCGEQDAGAIDLDVSGGSGDITVAWDHGAEGTSLSGLAGGQYYAVVTDDNGCTEDVRVMVEDSPTVEANFTTPSAGLTDGVNGMTMSFTNTSEGNITGQTWYFGDTETPSYDFHATHTFEVAGAYDVFLNVWNDKCSHTVRKTVVASQGESHNNDLGNLVTTVAEGNLTEIHAPVTTESGWMMDLGPAGQGMTVHVFDLTGRQLCTPVGADGNGQIWIEGDQWPALVLLRLVHEPTNSIRTWKMVR
ncbi:MAG: PKD domain-containing protein, partial [Bacteroidota bacterium]|nr:PKD domain-containing protein [Bacteroidota bacterium]